MNEAGKTAFLRSLTKAKSINEADKYDHVEDYPRKAYTVYAKVHKDQPALVAKLTYRLDPDEVNRINKVHDLAIKEPFEFSTNHFYNNTCTISGFHIPETNALRALINHSDFSTDTRTTIKDAKSLKAISEILSKIELTPQEEILKQSISERTSKSNWENTIEHEVWSQSIKPIIPKFFYFDDYHTLPGKINLADLENRISQSAANPGALEPTHRAVMALLRMAGIELSELTDPDGYEPIKAKLEAISSSITDQVFNFWKQNGHLEVEFDIRPDSKELAPFNNGANLYIRIKNQRHRVSVPFNQRSKGFIWFFSFLAWFDSIQQQLVDDEECSNIILLLDEPGLSLHALAQADFLRYIDDLSSKHQVLYTTHSPFMVHSDRLHQVRVVEDRDQIGTVISDNIDGSDPKTIFPLQAALGYTLAQNLFVSKRNLLVEGPADLIYLKFFSLALESLSRPFLREDITIVPTGGLDKVATFIALLGGNQLEMCIMHDSNGSPDQRILDLVKNKMINEKQVLNYSYFRDNIPLKAKKGSTSSNKEIPTDVEDLISINTYLEQFNAVYING